MTSVFTVPVSDPTVHITLANAWTSPTDYACVHWWTTVFRKTKHRLLPMKKATTLISYVVCLMWLSTLQKSLENRQMPYAKIANQSHWVEKILRGFHLCSSGKCPSFQCLNSTEKVRMPLWMCLVHMRWFKTQVSYVFKGKLFILSAGPSLEPVSVKWEWVFGRPGP